MNRLRFRPAEHKYRICLLLLVLCVARRAGAQQATPTPGPIVMQLGSPLAITAQPLLVQAKFGRWFPVAVTLSNSGEPVRGTLTLSLVSSAGESGPTSQFSVDIDLPTIARKRFWIYGRLERGEIDTAEIALRGHGFTPLVQRFSLRSPDENARTVLTISDGEERLSYLSGLRGSGFALRETASADPNFPIPRNRNFRNRNRGVPPVVPSVPIPSNAANRRLIQPLGASHEMVPDRWIGLDAVDTLVLHDFAHQTLTPPQVAALRGYVAGGGTLVVFGGTNWQRLAQSPLADLWPLTLTGSSVAAPPMTEQLINRFVGAPPVRRNGADRLGGAPVMAMRGILKPQSYVMEGTPQAPLIVLMNYGAGQVRFLSVDITQPPFLGWSGLPNLWRALFAGSPAPAQIEGLDARLEMPGFTPDQTYYGGYSNIEEPSATRNLLQELVQTPQLNTPPVSYIAWFLALYVFVLVPVNYVLLRFFDKREWAWITVPIIVVVFSVASYAAALRIKGNMVRTRLVNIVQGSTQAREARSDAMLWLFSPRKGYYNVQGDSPTMAVAPYLDGNDEAGSGVVIQEVGDQSFQVTDATINMWDWKTFVGSSVVDLKQGFTVTTQKSGATIHNGTPFNWRGVVLVQGGEVFRAGDIAAGRKSVVSIARRDARTDSNAPGPLIFGQIMRAARLEDIFQGGTALNKIAQSSLSLALGSQFGKPAYVITPGTGENPFPTLQQRRQQERFHVPLLIAWSEQPATSLRVEGEDPHAQTVTLLVLRLPKSPLPIAP